MKTLIESEHPEWSNMVKYQDRIVAFLDILGFSSLMNDVSFDPTPIIGILSAINDPAFRELLNNEANLEGIEITSISDSIVISIQHDEPDSYDKLVRMLFAVVTMFADHNIALRGAISRGLLHHNNNIVLGPALVRAYTFEKNSAIYPRCIIDEDIEADLLQLGMQDKAVFSYFIQDYDGKKYLDIFLYMILNIPRIPKCFETLKRTRSMIVENLRKFNDPKKLLNLHIWGKYEWYASRFNHTLRYTQKYLDLQIDDSDIYKSF